MKGCRWLHTDTLYVSGSFARVEKRVEQNANPSPAVGLGRSCGRNPTSTAHRELLGYALRANPTYGGSCRRERRQHRLDRYVQARRIEVQRAFGRCGRWDEEIPLAQIMQHLPLERIDDHVMLD